MKIFKTKRFARWAKKEELSDIVLRQAVHEMNDGLVDAKLGKFLYKKRIALRGQGKRSSARTLLAFKTGEKAFFIFGFAKKTMENIDTQQLHQLKILAMQFVKYSDRELSIALAEKELVEVNDDE